HTRRSARRAMARARWQAAAGGPPPGRMNSLSDGSASLNPSSACSSCVTCAAVMALWPGMHSSPPRSHSWCCTSVRQAVIDGTRSFVRESPFFSTQIALMRGGRFVLGVSNAPAYGELAWAEQGAGAWLNERAVRVSAVADLAAAAISSGNLKSMARSPRWRRYGELIARVSYSRGYGDFAHYHMLSRGAL